MRIIHIVPKPPYQGGLETFAGQLCEQLVERRYDVTWYCLNKSLRNKSKKCSKKGIIIKEFKPLFDDPFYIPSRDFLKELKQEDADIIHIHNLHTLLPLLVIVFARNLQARIVLQPHYHVQGQSFMRNMFFSAYKKLLKLLIFNFNVIVVNSKFERAAFMRDYPEASHRLILIPEEQSIVIPPEMKWNPVKHQKKILYVGVLKKYKNVDILIRAFKILVPKISNLELTIVGKGAQKEELIKLAANLGVNDGIAWKSDLTYNELLKEYSEAHVVVHLSELESFSRVVHEAMAIGTPLVVYNHGALGTIAEEGLAKGVADLDPMNVADAIAAAIKNRSQQKTLDFLLKGGTYVKSIEKLYRKILEI
jgi:glycosyltransferase involved in cell wall biosynthesis